MAYEEPKSIEIPNVPGGTYQDETPFNPPCAFTPYATCPLPPRSNILPFKVKDGEKKPGIDMPHAH